MAVVVVAVGMTVVGMIIVVAKVMSVVPVSMVILAHRAMQEPRARSVHDKGRGGNDEHDRLLRGDIPLDRFDGLVDDFRRRQEQEDAVHERG